MRRVATGKQNTISQVEFTDLVALTKRGAETGELFAYEPSTRQVEVYRGPRSTPVEVYTLTSRPPAFAGALRREPVAPAGRQRERRAGRASTSSRGSPDDPDPEPEPPPLARIRGFSAASARLIVHLDRRNAAMRLA